MMTYNDYLMHHGILGQKWGVRRYQNYDGTYTMRGMERYRKSKEKRESAEKEYKIAKENYRQAVKSKDSHRILDEDTNRLNSRRRYKEAKREEKSQYKKLKTDKLADQGKELYKNGNTITLNNASLSRKLIGLSLADVAAIRALNSYAIRSGGHYIQSGPLVGMSIEKIAALGVNGATILAAAGFSAKTASDNKKLRAYYAR